MSSRKRTSIKVTIKELLSGTAGDVAVPDEAIQEIKKQLPGQPVEYQGRRAGVIGEVTEAGYIHTTPVKQEIVNPCPLLLDPQDEIQVEVFVKSGQVDEVLYISSVEVVDRTGVEWEFPAKLEVA
jgi:hypothetical protein